MSIDVPADNSPGLTDEENFCLAGCSSYPQYHLMRNNFERGFCVFCNLDRERNEVLWEDAHFMLWKIPAGIGKKRPLEHHILIVPKKHVRFMADLSYAAAISLIKANRYAKDVLGYGGGVNHAREGDMRNNAGTVPHLHWSRFEPNGTEEVRVPVFKDPKDREENIARASRFAYQYNQGVTPEEFEKLVMAGRMSKEGSPRQPNGHSEC